MAKHAVSVNDVGKPLCILFPGGLGTASMRRLARAYGLRVIEYTDLE
jgi:hypothetical protein